MQSINYHSENRVAIILSTYNGEKYIGEQLESIINQSYRNWCCYIRDDGSFDNTCVILKKYELIDSRIKFLDDKRGNLGLNASHYYMLSLPNENYISIADQDDVWDPKKLNLSLKKIKEIETKERIPALVHTNSVFVDADLGVIRDKFIGARGLRIHLSGIIFANSVQGGSIIINKSLNDISIKIFPVLPYDYHLGILSNLTGVRGFIPDALLKYRQHCKSSIATANIEYNRRQAYNKLSSTLALSLSGYYHIKNDFTKATITEQAKKALADYLYLFEGTSALKKTWITVRNYYPFYRKKDFLYFIKMILTRQTLLVGPANPPSPQNDREVLL